MKKIVYLLLALFLVAIQYSCTDESTFNNPATNDLERGAFARFSEGSSIPGILFDPAGINASAEIFDPSNNIAEYALQLNANVGGTQYYAENFLSVTNLPANINITSEAIAEAIDINVSDISFGDSFTFTARVTRNDGTVFYGIQPTFDQDSGTVGVGNTTSPLFTSAFNDAMRFVIALACPPSPPGEYRIEMFDSFGDGWQTNDGNAGDGIQITVDNIVLEVGMCSPYNNSQVDFCTTWPDTPGFDPTSDYTEAEAFVTIPAGAEVVLWIFPGDQYGEISFNIYNPDGDLVGAYGPGTPSGLLILCDGDLGS